MNCRRFRKLHVAFIDGRVTARQAEQIYAHLEACERCARLDTVIRRGLLVARNLPPIHPSSSFMPRLQARLRGRTEREPRLRTTTVRRILEVGAAAVVIGAGIVGVARINGLNHMHATAPAVPVRTAYLPVHHEPMQHSPVNSVQPTPVFGVDLAGGMPIWSGVLVAEQAADHLASNELQRTEVSP